MSLYPFLRVAFIDKVVEGGKETYYQVLLKSNGSGRVEEVGGGVIAMAYPSCGGRAHKDGFGGGAFIYGFKPRLV